MTDLDFKELEKMATSLNERVAATKDLNSCQCSFCKKKSSEIRQLFSGPENNLYICDECVNWCHSELKHYKSA